MSPPERLAAVRIDTQSASSGHLGTSTRMVGGVAIADIGAYENAERNAIQTIDGSNPWKTLAERAANLGVRGQRLPTGLATLDQATRGGPLTGRVISIGGAPGAGK